MLTFLFHFFCLNRKQRKGNGVKRVCKETLSRSDSEEGSSDEELDVIGEENQNDKGIVKLLEEKRSEGYTAGRLAAYPRAAKTNAWTRHVQTIKQQQASATRSLINKNLKQSKGQNVKSREDASKAMKETSGSEDDKDLAIDIEAFVHHSPVVEDIDQVTTSFACPFCSVLCRNKQDVIQHIKDCHNSGEIAFLINPLTLKDL